MIKIAIFGVGLIGGSLALCFKGKPGLRVVGHSPREQSVRNMLEREAVDEATTSISEAAQDADFIFLCTPVGTLKDYLQELQGLPLKPGCIITDVGSTKGKLADQASQLTFPGSYFIGGHPMAGKEKSGLEAASSLLFENAYYVLTPDHKVPEEATGRLKELLKHTRAHLVSMDPHFHDEVVGAVSHLPHIIAVALVNQIAGYNETNEMYQYLAAGGFRDITRIASSEPMVWRDILLSNREVLLKLLQDWNKEISSFTEMLERADAEGITKAFQSAGVFRGGLPERRKGVLTSFFDIYVDVPDHPGIIGHIASLLGDAGINLSNIHIIESREEVPGVLRLSFRNQHDTDGALKLLRQNDYSVHL
ncbi:prephenate dehydrogenase [Paenibacillus sp. y28]|uniref:prephenate dehydrogenase n=1 Tax=Paenibacillus sp. y28 TaxID=3129110 RepID=UPI003017D404